MNDQSARTSAEPAASTQERAERQLMIKHITSGITPAADLRSALRDLLAEANAPATPTVPPQTPPSES